MQRVLRGLCKAAFASCFGMLLLCMFWPADCGGLCLAATVASTAVFGLFLPSQCYEALARLVLPASISAHFCAVGLRHVSR